MKVEHSGWLQDIIAVIWTSVVQLLSSSPIILFDSLTINRLWPVLSTSQATGSLRTNPQPLTAPPQKTEQSSAAAN